MTSILRAMELVESRGSGLGDHQKEARHVIDTVRYVPFIAFAKVFCLEDFAIRPKLVRHLTLDSIADTTTEATVHLLTI
jgi:hypothetical protein